MPTCKIERVFSLLQLETSFKNPIRSDSANLSKGGKCYSHVFTVSCPKKSSQRLNPERDQINFSERPFREHKNVSVVNEKLFSDWHFRNEPGYFSYFLILQSPLD